MRNYYAAFTLNRFEHDRDGLIADRFFQRRDIIEIDQLESRHQRLKSLVILFLTGRAQRRHRAAVKRPQRREDFEAAFAVLVAPSTREFYRGFICLGARVAEEDLAVAETFRETLDQTRTRLGMKYIRSVSEFFRLILNRADYSLMPMAEASHC